MPFFGKPVLIQSIPVFGLVSFWPGKSFCGYYTDAGLEKYKICIDKCQ